MDRQYEYQFQQQFNSYEQYGAVPKDAPGHVEQVRVTLTNAPVDKHTTAVLLQQTSMHTESQTQRMQTRGHAGTQRKRPQSVAFSDDEDPDGDSGSDHPNREDVSHAGRRIRRKVEVETHCPQTGRKLSAEEIRRKKRRITNKESAQRMRKKRSEDLQTLQCKASQLEQTRRGLANAEVVILKMNEEIEALTAEVTYYKKVFKESMKMLQDERESRARGERQAAQEELRMGSGQSLPVETPGPRASCNGYAPFRVTSGDALPFAGGHPHLHSAGYSQHPAVATGYASDPVPFAGDHPHLHSAGYAQNPAVATGYASNPVSEGCPTHQPPSAGGLGPRHPHSAGLPPRAANASGAPAFPCSPAGVGAHQGFAGPPVNGSLVAHPRSAANTAYAPSSRLDTYPGPRDDVLSDVDRSNLFSQAGMGSDSFYVPTDDGAAALAGSPPEAPLPCAAMPDAGGARPTGTTHHAHAGAQPCLVGIHPLAAAPAAAPGGSQGQSPPSTSVVDPDIGVLPQTCEDPELGSAADFLLDSPLHPGLGRDLSSVSDLMADYADPAEGGMMGFSASPTRPFARMSSMHADVAGWT